MYDRVVQPNFEQYDVTLKSIPSKNTAVFLINNNEYTVTSIFPLKQSALGMTGILQTYLKLGQIGDCYLFHPYKVQSLRRSTVHDRPGEWAWRCQATGDIEWRANGVPPEHWIPVI
ncbi:hypothetical protein [Ralstonia sp. GX3-BWBA]|uniref:hypothetical protein n=1 Tax=Ralstonia sp. GX3-BWBA TaxID=2219865 RepID=UPI000DD2FD93|nr:hypothetical protein [Ralstonia sp. GX3-BWBA]